MSKYQRLSKVKQHTDLMLKIQMMKEMNEKLTIPINYLI